MSTTLKITVVGDDSSGKSSLLKTYSKNRFEQFAPPVLINHGKNIFVNGKNYNLIFTDTAECGEYGTNRTECYPDTHAILLCYSVVDRQTFNNVLLKWIPELDEYAKSVPIILVGTKTDLRTKKAVAVVTSGEGRILKKRIRAADFIECSALNIKNIDEIFEAAVKAVEFEKEKVCSIQ